MEEALAQDPGEPCPPLATDTTADVVILGGGYTGMWTAFFLKERDPGIDVVLLERDICGGGPSGRNGGFVNGFWDELPLLAELHGDRPPSPCAAWRSRASRTSGRGARATA
jgi:glycine/D-amino acid oxidase-like deaminating enzyme